MTASEVRVIDERPGLVAVDKPAGLPTERAPGFEECLLDRVGEITGRVPRDLHAINRLDVVVSGVVLVATCREARQWAAGLVAERRIQRRYIGFVTAAPRPRAGWWTAPIGRGRGKRRVGGPDAETAVTAYTTAGRAGALLCLGLCPQTGRTHQLRVHAAHAGSPLLFDRRYGGEPRIVLSDGSVITSPRIGLHAGRARVPLDGADWVVTAPLPHELVVLWNALGGSDADIEAALETSAPPCETPGE